VDIYSFHQLIKRKRNGWAGCLPGMAKTSFPRRAVYTYPHIFILNCPVK